MLGQINGYWLSNWLVCDVLGVRMADDVKLEGEDVLAHKGGPDGRGGTEEVGRFCRGLVEEAEGGGEGGEVEGPEL